MPWTTLSFVNHHRGVTCKLLPRSELSGSITNDWDRAGNNTAAIRLGLAVTPHTHTHRRTHHRSSLSQHCTMGSRMASKKDLASCDPHSCISITMRRNEPPSVTLCNWRRKTAGSEARERLPRGDTGMKGKPQGVDGIQEEGSLWSTP